MDKNFKNKAHLFILGNQILLINSLFEWRNQPEKSLRLIFKNNYNNHFDNEEGKSSKDLLEYACKATSINLLMQTFNCSYEYLRHNIDDRMTTNLKNLRNDLSDNKSNLNTTKLLDVIRQSFAHNDISALSPNWTIDRNLKIKIKAKGTDFNFHYDEFRGFMNEFLNLKQNHFGLKLDISYGRIKKCIKNGQFQEDSCTRYIKETHDDGTTNLIDKNQSKTLYNLICNELYLNDSSLDRLFENNYYLFSELFPCMNNAGYISRTNNLIERALMCLPNCYEFRSKFILASKLNEERVSLIDNDDIRHASNNRIKKLDYLLKATDLFEIYLISNIIFNLFSLFPVSIIEDYLGEKDIDFRHLRNSVMHGKYYYNYNGGFEFYDGRDNDLSHIASLGVEDILGCALKILDNELEHTKIN